MGKGKSQTTTTSSKPPPQFMNAYTNLLNAGSALASQPLQQYGGPMVAGFTPMQDQAFSTINNTQGMAAPFINSAARYASEGATPITPTAFSANQVNQYMSPYVQNVVDATQRQFNTANAEAQTGLSGNLAAAGAFGGDRSAVMAAELAKQQKLAQDPVIAGLYDKGYGNALSEFNTQQGVGMQAQEATNQGAQNAAYAMGMLGPEAQNTALTGAGAELNAGNMQQGLAQEELNIPYEQFIQKQAYPYQNLNFLGALDTSLGSVAGGTGSTTQPGPNPWSQLGGLALSAASLIPFKRGGRLRGMADGGGADPNIERMEMIDMNSDADHAAGVMTGIPNVPNPGGGYVPSASMGAHGSGPPAPPQVQGQQASAYGGMGSLPGNLGTGLSNLGADIFGSAGGKDAAGSAGFLSGIGSFLGFERGGHVPHYDTGGAISYVPGSHDIPTPQINQSAFAAPPPETPGATPDWFNPLPQYHPPAATSVPGHGTSTTTPLSPAILAALRGLRSGQGGGLNGMNGTGGISLQNLLGGMSGLTFARGGAAHLADGGDADDAALPNSPMPDDLQDAPKNQGMSFSPMPEADHNAPQGSAGMATRVLNTDEMPAGWSATHTGDSGKGFDYVPPKPDWRQALLAAGAAMLSGTSPNAGVNIGRGIQSGLEYYNKQSELDAHPEVDHSGQTIRIYYPSEKKWIDTGMPTDSSVYHTDTVSERRDRDLQAAQDRADRLKQSDREFGEREQDRKAQLEISRINADTGRYTWSPGTQADPNTGAPVQGMWRLPTRGSEQPTFMPNAGLTSKKTQAGMSDAEALANAQKDYDRFFPVPKPDPSNPGQPVPPRSAPKEGMQTWLQKRAAAYKHGAGTQAPTASAAPPTNTLGTPGGLSGPPPGFKKAPDGNWYAPDPQRPGKYVQWTP